MRFRLVLEVGDTVTVARPNHTGGRDTFRDVKVNSVPEPDRFTFFAYGKLFDARVEDVAVLGAWPVKVPVTFNEHHALRQAPAAQ